MEKDRKVPKDQKESKSKEELAPECKKLKEKAHHFEIEGGIECAKPFQKAHHFEIEGGIECAKPFQTLPIQF